MSQEIELVLSNPFRPRDKFSVGLKLLDTPVAKRWFREFKRAVRLRLPIEKHYCFMGLPKSPRNLGYLCREMNRFIRQVNHFSKTSWEWNNSYRIKERFSPHQVEHKGTLNQELMNRIHHHFELLVGQVWKMSPYYLTADLQTRYAIAQLNNLCHEMEHLVKAKVAYRKDPNLVRPTTIISLAGRRRLPLHDEDFEHFTFHCWFGKVSLMYAQTGKTHYEAFSDRDQEIDDSNISGLRYYSGECVIDWGQTIDPFHWKKEEKHFHDWLRRKGYDPANKKLALGQCPIAQIPREQFGSMGIPQIHALLSKHTNIQRIIARGRGKTVEAHYPLSWASSTYEKRAIRFGYE